MESTAERLDNIEQSLRRIEGTLDRLCKDLLRMNAHIDFVENVADHIRNPVRRLFQIDIAPPPPCIAPPPHDGTK